MACLSHGEKISKIALFVLAQLTNVTDRRTDRRTPHAGNSRAMHSIARQKLVYICQIYRRKKGGTFLWLMVYSGRQRKGFESVAQLISLGNVYDYLDVTNKTTLAMKHTSDVMIYSPDTMNVLCGNIATPAAWCRLHALSMI